ncbi:MAG: hypothetical protein AB7R89_32875, partial [Dehalococcoidia bacterium]
EARVKLTAAYNEAAAAQAVDVSGVDHVHALICLVTDEPETEARTRLHANVLHSYKTGDWPHVPQAAGRHAGPDGSRPSQEHLAEMTVAAAAVGTPAAVADQLSRFIEVTGAVRIALFMEMAADPATILHSIRSFAEDVAPALEMRFPAAISA